MTLYLAAGSPTTEISDQQLVERFHSVLDRWATAKRVLALPPDFTRCHSRAGTLTCLAHAHFGDRLTDVMPALGTHAPMTAQQLDKMFPGLPHGLIRPHRWRARLLRPSVCPPQSNWGRAAMGRACGLHSARWR